MGAQSVDFIALHFHKIGIWFQISHFWTTVFWQPKNLGWVVASLVLQVTRHRTQWLRNDVRQIYSKVDSKYMPVVGDLTVHWFQADRLHAQTMTNNIALVRCQKVL